ncbi:hypothetical protein Ddc_09671 [Ditylenchus destructor]|nr:hypothetical protein Ddc_09671 [Ditylenchus destructor]
MSGDIPRLLTALWDWGRCWTDCHGLRGCSSRHFWETTQEVQKWFQWVWGSDGRVFLSILIFFLACSHFVGAGVLIQNHTLGLGQSFPTPPSLTIFSTGQHYHPLSTRKSTATVPAQVPEAPRPPAPPYNQRRVLVVGKRWKKYPSQRAKPSPAPKPPPPTAQAEWKRHRRQPNDDDSSAPQQLKALCSLQPIAAAELISPLPCRAMGERPANTPNLLRREKWDEARGYVSGTEHQTG